MNQPSPFLDRRQNSSGATPPPRERRQFVDRRDHLPADVRELADAVDRYKLEHCRRFITLEELLSVVLSLGYRKEATPRADAQAAQPH